MKLQKYIPINWVDRIWKLGPDGKLIPKKDSNGNIIKNPLTGMPEYETIVNGTRVKASNLNHMDENIYLNREYLIAFQRQLKSIIAQLELDGRVPSPNGNFLDAFDGSSSRIKLLTELTYVKSDVTAGSNIALSVIDASQFKAFTYATIFDGANYEHVYITAIDTSANMITVQTLANDYTKGAIIARSTVSVDTVNQEMIVGDHVQYEVELVEVV